MTSRSITGLVLAALLAAPVAAEAQSRRGGGSGGSGVWLGGLFGAEFGDWDGFQVRAEGEFPITRLTPRVGVAGVISASYAGLEDDLTVFEVLPAVRLNWYAGSSIGLYGDLGLGIAHASQDDVSDTGATMRIGAGAFYQMTSSIRFPIEVAVHPHFGDYDPTTTTLMIGVKFRL